VQGTPRPVVETASVIVPLSSEAPPVGEESSAASLLRRLERPAILLLGDNTSIRFWNRGAEALYGWTAEEALGRRLSWLAAEGHGDPALVMAELTAVRMSGGGEREERRRRADGSTVTVAVRKTLEADGGIWEVSEACEHAAGAVSVLPAGLGEWLGADLLVFDHEGRLKECSPTELCNRLSAEETARAESLAVRALRTGKVCEAPGTVSAPWLRACLVPQDGAASAVVLMRRTGGSSTCAETELRRLTDLCRRLLEAQESERRRLAAELHDELGQTLTGLLYGLESENTPRETLRLEAAALLAKVRGLSQGLRPGVLDDLGLAAARRWLAAEHQRRWGTEVVVAAPPPGRRWPTEVETGVFRIVQEALTNVARHASAKRIVITLDEQNGELQMSIADDGIGFDADEAGHSSTGIEGMRERALLLGGRFEVHSASGEGTRIEASLPLLAEPAP
jgi:PAS domain S-box-containing protein